MITILPKWKWYTWVAIIVAVVNLFRDEPGNALINFCIVWLILFAIDALRRFSSGQVGWDEDLLKKPDHGRKPPMAE